MPGENKSSDSILAYLETQNRPYSLNDIYQNLHQKYGKTAIQKDLDLLIADGKIKEKINGKQKAYVIDQNKQQVEDEKKLSQMDNDLKAKETMLEEKLKLLVKTEGYLKGLLSLPVTEELFVEMSKVEVEIEELQIKLESLKKNSKDSDIRISKDNLNKYLKEKDSFVKEWKKRKRIFLTVTDAILENYPKPKKALMEEIGIETEQDLGIEIPQS